jgi:hypothetical protein
VEDPARNRLRSMLGELLDRIEGAQDVASRIAQEYPEYEAMSEAVHRAAEMVAMACELEAYGPRESDDEWRLLQGRRLLLMLWNRYRFFPPQPHPSMGGKIWTLTTIQRPPGGQKPPSRTGDAPPSPSQQPPR